MHELFHVASEKLQICQVKKKLESRV